MAKMFEELDYQMTPIGPISLQKRRIAMLGGQEVYEVKLGDEYLMSSLFHASEDALAEIGLALVSESSIDVVVGGLGLGYTAAAALKDSRVRSLLVVEALAPVIDWHHKALVPLGGQLSSDPRCRLVKGDFFALAASEADGFDPAEPSRKFHAVLLDIDHSPTNLLNPRSESFYTVEGLTRLSRHLHDGGVFALWSNDPPEEEFLNILRQVFTNCEAKIIEFDNPIQNRKSSNSIYTAIRRPT